MADKQPDILDFDIEHERKPHNREGNHGYYYCDLLNSEHGGPTYECNCGLPEAIAAHGTLLADRDSLDERVKAHEEKNVRFVARYETAEAQVEVLRDALRGLLPYVDTSKASAFRAIEAAEQALEGKTDGN